jgi:4-amino-4-deoxy-L-arabinose transferase-like glycosyltransferase
MNVNKELLNKKEQIVTIAFIALTAILIAVGICAMKIPVVAMCVLVILEAAIAGLLHHAQLWVHGALVLAELIAGFASGKAVLTVMCVVVYVAGLVMLNQMDKGEA